MSLPFFDGLDLLREGRRKEEEKMIQFRWIVGGYERSIPFGKFKAELENAAKKNAPRKYYPAQTEEEILKKVEKILGG